MDVIMYFRVEDGLYQRYVNGVPSNVYIDRVSRMSKSGKTRIVEGWALCWKTPDGYEGNGDYCKTLREAKQRYMDWKER